MKAGRDRRIERLLGILNRDIVREFRMADACLRQAACLPRQYHPVARRLIAACAAVALANATALAAEVRALGGSPVIPGRRAPAEPLPTRPIGSGLAAARTMLAHYRRRLRTAQELRLPRLREVLRQILRTRQRHLLHIAFIEAGSPGRYAWN